MYHHQTKNNNNNNNNNTSFPTLNNLITITQKNPHLHQKTHTQEKKQNFFQSRCNSTNLANVKENCPLQFPNAAAAAAKAPKAPKAARNLPPILSQKQKKTAQKLCKQRS